MGNVFKIIGIIVVVAVVIKFGVPIVDLRSDDPVVTLVKFEQIRNGMKLSNQTARASLQNHVFENRESQRQRKKKLLPWRTSLEFLI